jgi:hypothetical protein
MTAVKPPNPLLNDALITETFNAHEVEQRLLQLSLEPVYSY